jgi:hypothetical protein
MTNTSKKHTPILQSFHFASDGIHCAEHIEAETIEAATAEYHKIKRLIHTSPPTPAPKEKDVEGV